jgi:hypothetical protein
MATTIANVQTIFNTAIGDTSTDRISAAERLNFITEGTIWLAQQLDNDHLVKTYSVSFFDTLFSYKLNAAVTDIFEGNALRRATTETDIDMTRKDSRQVLTDVSEYSSESSYALERRDGNLFLVINHDSKYSALLVDSFDSLTANGGTWQADTTNSDATNVEIDTVDGSNGTTGCLSFDVDVSQSGNNRATIYNDDLTDEDLSDQKDLSSWIIDMSFPIVTYLSSVTFYWGSSSSNYYSVTQTTNYDGSAFSADFLNTLKFAWLGATVTGTPDDEAINYIRIDVNYTGSQADATSYKIDNLRLVRPEKLTFHYTSWNIGTDTTGASQLKRFTATTDIPFYSGQYDQYDYVVGHKAAALAFRTPLRLPKEADAEELEALKQLNLVKKVIPKSRPAELKSFKVRGISFNRGRNRRFRI